MSSVLCWPPGLERVEAGRVSISTSFWVIFCSLTTQFTNYNSGHFLIKKTYIMYILFYFSLKKGMKHVMTCQANAASDWLALAALKSVTGWAGLCAKKPALIWHSTSWTTLLLPLKQPWRAGPTTAIFEHVHVRYRCIYRHDLRVRASVLEPLKFLWCDQTRQLLFFKKSNLSREAYFCWHVMLS